MDTTIKLKLAFFVSTTFFVFIFVGAAYSAFRLSQPWQEWTMISVCVIWLLFWSLVFWQHRKK